MDLWIERLRTAFATFRTNLLRTALTALAVAMGAAAMALMVSLTTSGVASIAAGIDRVGGRQMIFIETRDEPIPGSPVRYDRGLTIEDVEALRARLPGVAEVALVSTKRGEEVTVDGKKELIDLAVGGAFRRIVGIDIEYGRDIAADDAGDDARVVVLAKPLAKDLFGAPERALGGTLVLWGHRYTVCGVTADIPAFRFNVGGVKQHRAVFVSNAAIAAHEGKPLNSFVLLKSNGEASHELIQRVANVVLRDRHKGTQDLDFFDLQAMIKAWDALFLGLHAVTALIAAVSVVIAGSGIMNVLLASLRQRVYEIGIRRALGATGGDIRAQLLIESALIALAGGVLGAASGLGLARLAGVFIRKMAPDWIQLLSIRAAVAGVLVSVLAGLVFGLLPARRGARLDVVACLRGGA